MTAVSCRPARLQRFGENVGSACTGLDERLSQLEAALDDYVASCSATYTVPGCLDAVTAIRAWRTDYAEFGTWTASVGTAVAVADAVNDFMAGHASTDLEGVTTVSEDDFLVQMDNEWDGDPLLGVDTTGVAASVGLGGGIASSDQDEPPAWLELIEDSGNAFDVATELFVAYNRMFPAGGTVTVSVSQTTGMVTYFDDGLVIAQMRTWEVTASAVLPPGSRFSSASRWLGRAGNAAAFVGGFASQWIDDDGLPGHERVLRATTRGTSVLAGTAAGAWALGGAGAWAGTACGPAAWICSPVLGFAGGVIGGVGGAILGDKAADWIPFMDDSSPKPVELDQERVEDLIADPSDGAGATDAQMATVELAAIDMARSDASADPASVPYLESVLPDPDALLAIINPPDPNVTATGTTTTTTTTTTTPPADRPVPTSPPAAPAPDPDGPPTGTTSPPTTVPG